MLEPRWPSYCSFNVPSWHLLPGLCTCCSTAGSVFPRPPHSALIKHLVLGEDSLTIHSEKLHHHFTWIYFSSLIVICFSDLFLHLFVSREIDPQEMTWPEQWVCLFSSLVWLKSVCWVWFTLQLFGRIWLSEMSESSRVQESPFTPLKSEHLPDFGLQVRISRILQRKDSEGKTSEKTTGPRHHLLLSSLSILGIRHVLPLVLQTFLRPCIHSLPWKPVCSVPQHSEPACFCPAQSDANCPASFLLRLPPQLQGFLSCGPWPILSEFLRVLVKYVNFWAPSKIWQVRISKVGFTPPRIAHKVEDLVFWHE